MFGLQQASAKNVKFCSDQPSGLKKPQICLDGPQKWLTLPPSDIQCNKKLITISHSASISSVLLTSPDFPQPFLRAPTIASHCVEQVLSVRDNKQQKLFPVAVITTQFYCLLLRASPEWLRHLHPPLLINNMLHAVEDLKIKMSQYPAKQMHANDRRGNLKNDK